MAFFCCNSLTHLESTPVSLLRTSFNIILYFSDNLTRAYLPNTPQYSRYIHQRGWSSPRSPTCTIQPVWTVLPISDPSIVPTDNDSNWENCQTYKVWTQVSELRIMDLDLISFSFYFFIFLFYFILHSIMNKILTGCDTGAE